MIDISHSQIKTALRCPYKWGLSYRLMLKPVEVSAPLGLGSLVHEGLERLHNDGEVDWNIVLAASDRQYNDDLVEQARALVDAYQAHYGDPHASVMPLTIAGGGVQQIMATEWGFAVDIYTPSGTRSNYRLIGVIDVISRDESGYYWIWDHKTSKQFPAVSVLAMDAQLGAYSWALSKMGLPVRGVVINRLRTTVTPVFERDYLVKSQDELAVWGQRVWEWCRALPSSKIPTKWLARHFTRDCYWDCEFNDHCTLQATGLTTEAITVLETEFIKGDGSHHAGVTWHEDVPPGWLKKGSAPWL
jgi:hypothetical protein